MVNDNSYLPRRSGSSPSADVLGHLRNKNLTLELERPRLWQRAARRLWWESSRLWDHARRRGPLQIVVSEQVIENAFVLRSLDPSVRRVLDFGGYESTLPLALAALGLEVTVVDQRSYPFVGPRLRVLQHNILEPLDELDAEFDMVYSISTIEHVGLGSYGEPSRSGGDRIALAHLWEKVRPGGRLLVSVPAGKPITARGYRVYDQATLRTILPSPGEIAFFRKRGRRGQWDPSDADEIAGLRYEDYLAQTPVEGLAIALLTKPTG